MSDTPDDDPPATPPATPPTTPAPDIGAAIQAHMDAAQAAQAAGDYRTAATQVRSAWMLVCGLPDSELSGERMRWDREALERMADHLQRLAATQPAADPHRPVGVMTATEVIYLRG